MIIWNFIEEELLGMKWLNKLIENTLLQLGIDTNGNLGGSICFFIYDMGHESSGTIVESKAEKCYRQGSFRE